VVRGETERRARRGGKGRMKDEGDGEGGERKRAWGRQRKRMSESEGQTCGGGEMKSCACGERDGQLPRVSWRVLPKPLPSNTLTNRPDLQSALPLHAAAHSCLLRILLPPQRGCVCMSAGASTPRPSPHPPSCPPSLPTPPSHHPHEHAQTSG
jgi:hypothetical protein